MPKRSLIPLFTITALLVGIAASAPLVRAAPLPSDLDSLREKARDHESKKQWADACRCYDEILKKDRSLLDCKEGYQRCLRHVLQVRRHRDAGFRQLLAGLKAPTAADIYEDVVVKLRGHYVDANQASLEALFDQGLREFGFALEDEVFLKEHLARIRPDAVTAFRRQLDQWRDRRFRTTQELREQVLDIALRARRTLGVEPAVVILEFACGACNGLDEYTTYLTPGQVNGATAALRGEAVGIGVLVEVVDQKLVITHVLPESNALEKRLRPGDRILEIDRQPVDPGAPELAADRLHGAPGTTVELMVATPSEAPRTVKVQRRALAIRSVESELLLDEEFRYGLVRILGFQETTLQEVRDALMQLQSMGMNALILDLRGCPGGLLPSAVRVTELFLTEGVIVLTHSRLRGHNRSYKADNPNAMDVPMVVLVDGDTASAAEVLAGALKDHQRATLIGQTTFGKGSIQLVLPLAQIPAGIRITVGRFYSPANQPYSGRGVTPNLVMDADGDALVSAARQEARRLAMMR